MERDRSRSQKKVLGQFWPGCTKVPEKSWDAQISSWWVCTWKLAPLRISFRMGFKNLKPTGSYLGVSNAMLTLKDKDLYYIYIIIYHGCIPCQGNMPTRDISWALVVWWSPALGPEQPGPWEMKSNVVWRWVPVTWAWNWGGMKVWLGYCWWKKSQTTTWDV